MQTTLTENELENRVEIGKGNFGVVEKATCRGTTVAVKVLKKVDQAALITFHKEVEISRSVNHPNIVPFMGVISTGNRNIIVSEFVSGGTLSNYIKNKQSTVIERLKIALNIATGLAWLHGTIPPIIHRDLKPDNILIDGHGVARICDFGLSQLKVNQWEKDQGKAVGTPYWMAPEVIAGKFFDHRSDIYSFGLLLWCLLTRTECPFTHHRDWLLFGSAVVVDKERPIIPDTCPPRLRNLINECWAHDPNARPSPDQIMKRLREIFIDISISDEHGRAFWEQYFLGREQVPWNEFIVYYLQYTHRIDPVTHSEFYIQEKFADVVLDNLTSFPTSILLELCTRLPYLIDTVQIELKRRETQGDEVEIRAIDILKSIIVTSDDIVTIGNFNEVLTYFGPFFHKNIHYLLNRVEDVVGNDAFDNGTDAEVANKVTQSNQFGSYLIRKSSKPGCFAFAVLGGIVNQSVRLLQHRFEYVLEKGYHVITPSVTNEYYPTLKQLIDGLALRFQFVHVCSRPGLIVKTYPYSHQELFQKFA